MPPKYAGYGSRRRRAACNNRIVPCGFLRWRWWKAAVTWINPCKNVFSGSSDSSHRLSHASCAAKNSPASYRCSPSASEPWVQSNVIGCKPLCHKLASERLRAKPLILPSNSDPHRHRMMKDIIRIVLPLYALKEWIEIAGAVIQLRPVGVLQHIDVRIVDIAPLISV